MAKKKSETNGFLFVRLGGGGSLRGRGWCDFVVVVVVFGERQIFMAKSAMQMHVRDAHRSDTKPHQCQQCLKSFSSNHQLVQHIRVHTGEKPYRCSYCDRRFKQLSHVQQHTRLHTGPSSLRFFLFFPLPTSA